MTWPPDLLPQPLQHSAAPASLPGDRGRQQLAARHMHTWDKDCPSAGRRAGPLSSLSKVTQRRAEVASEARHSDSRELTDLKTDVSNYVLHPGRACGYSKIVLEKHQVGEAVQELRVSVEGT